MNRSQIQPPRSYSVRIPEDERTMVETTEHQYSRVVDVRFKTEWYRVFVAYPYRREDEMQVEASIAGHKYRKDGKPFMGNSTASTRIPVSEVPSYVWKEVLSRIEENRDYIAKWSDQAKHAVLEAEIWGEQR